MKTFEDTKGNVFSNYSEARASNQALALPAITPSSLQPVEPFKIDEPKRASGTDGTLAFLNAQATAYGNDLQQKADQAQQPLGDLEGQISRLLAAPGEKALTAQAYEKSGVNTAEAELKDINSQILGEQVALQRQLEELDKNPEGMSTRGLEAEKQRVKDASLRRQADLSIIQMTKQGKFDSAKQIADRAVAALTEAKQNKINALQFLYDKYGDRWNKADQRAFEVKQKQREDELNFERDRIKSEYSQQLQMQMLDYEQKVKQSDPLYALQIQKMRKEISLLGEPTAKEKKEAADALKEAQASVPVMQDKIAAVDTLLSHPGLKGSVGATGISRTPFISALTGTHQDFAGGIHKLVGGLTLDNLIQAKQRGATFGALSEGELQLLANSASTINDWEVKDREGKPTGTWNIDEASFKRELENIRMLTQRALVQSGQNLLDSEEQSTLDEFYNQSNPGSFYQ